MVPVFAFFTVFLFLGIERFWLKETIFWVVISAFVFFHINNSFLDKSKALSNNSSILLSKNTEVRFNGDAVRNKTILLLGANPNALIHNKQVTVYGEWNLSLRHFSDLNNYENISAIYSNIIDNKPEFIFDNISMMPNLIQRIPELKKMYEPSYDKKAYRLIQ